MSLGAQIPILDIELVNAIESQTINFRLALRRFGGVK